MYLESIESFVEQAEELYRANPLKCRYCMKYRHCDGKLVLKITDNTTCLQYKTDKQADLKRLEKLHNIFFALMATGQEPLDDVHMKAVDQPQSQNSKGRRRG